MAKEQVELTNLSAKPLIVPKDWRSIDSRPARIKVAYGFELDDKDRNQIRLWNKWKSDRCIDYYNSVMNAPKQAKKQ